jgi:hypothetical protein
MLITSGDQDTFYYGTSRFITTIQLQRPPRSVFGGGGCSGIESTITEATSSLLYQIRMMNDDEYGAIGGMLDRGNRIIWIKPVPMPLCPPQIPHYLTGAWTRAAAVENRRLNAWTTVQPSIAGYRDSFTVFILQKEVCIVEAAPSLLSNLFF